jgi:hypothetical protein
MSARRIAAAIVGAEVAFAGLFGAFGVLHSNAVAYADTGDPGTILLSEIHNADMFPVCELEDCSDQPAQVIYDTMVLGKNETLTESERYDENRSIKQRVQRGDDQPAQVGMWLDRDTGNWWLSLGESSLLVIDDSVTR